MDTIMNVAVGALACLGGVVALLKVVAPMTNTEWDNKILKFLSAVVSAASGVVTPKVASK